MLVGWAEHPASAQRTSCSRVLSPLATVLPSLLKTASWSQGDSIPQMGHFSTTPRLELRDSEARGCCIQTVTKGQAAPSTWSQASPTWPARGEGTLSGHMHKELGRAKGSSFPKSLPQKDVSLGAEKVMLL